MAKKTERYDNETISLLKGADRVRKRPAVIFGSDGIEGCQQAIFEIFTNSIDEAREGYGKKITVYFIKKMRDIKKFVSQNDLRAQLDLDEKNSIAILNGHDIKPLCNVLTEPTQI